MILWLWILVGIVLAVIGVKAVFDVTRVEDDTDYLLEALRRIT